MASANIIAVFKDTGLTVKIDIRTISDNELVIEQADMTEMSDGAYKYIFTSYDSNLDYLFICKDQYGNKVFAANESISDIVDAVWDEPTIDHSEIGTTGLELSNIKINVDGIQSDLDNETDGLGAIKSTSDSIESKVDIIDTEVGIIGTLTTFIKKAFWNKKELTTTGVADDFIETLYDDDGTSVIRRQSIKFTTPETQTRDNIL